VTFQQRSERSGVPVELLLVIREAAGSAPADPQDRMRDGELPIAEFIEAQVAAGFRPISIERLIRVQGDSLRYGQTVNIASRIAEYARPGEVLVSQAVVDAWGSVGADVGLGAAGAAFAEIGPVELKGVAGAMALYAAHRGS
jgi:class 3 adenylate cyclase